MTIDRKQHSLLSGGGYSESSRIQYIDALKGFSIFCVVLGHLAVGYMEMGTFPEAHTLLYAIRNLIYAFHMPLFMMISGYVYSAAYSDSSGRINLKRVYRREKNLIAIYIIWSVLTGIARILLSQFVNATVTVQDLMLIPVKAIAPYWYLYVLIFFYFIFSTEFWERIGRWKAIEICVISCIVGNFISVDWISFSKILYYALFFYIGMIYRKENSWILGNRTLILISLPLAILLIVFCWDYGQEVIIAELPLIRTLIALGISLAIWYAFEHWKYLKENRFLSFIGRHSLEIYVMHHFITAASRLLPKFGVTNVYVVLIIALIAGILFPILFSAICKNIGIYGFFFEPLTYLRGRDGYRRKVK